MKKYGGGEPIPQGAYMGLSKAPAPLVVIVGPLAGLAFIILLPLMGVLSVAGLLAYKMGRGARALGRRVVQTAAMGWRPGIAYLIRRGRTPEQEQPSEGAELSELEEEIARRRQREGK